MPCGDRFAPVRLRLLQVSGRVVMMPSGPRLTWAEPADRRNEQPYQRTPTALHQPLPNGATRELTAITCGSSALSFYCPPNANGLGPPPTLTTIRVRQFRHCGGALLVTLWSQNYFLMLIVGALTSSYTSAWVQTTLLYRGAGNALYGLRCRDVFSERNRGH
jgi:hypothetical protein